MGFPIADVEKSKLCEARWVQDCIQPDGHRFPRRDTFGVVCHGASADSFGDMQGRGVPMLAKDSDRYGLKFPIGKRAGRKVIVRLDHAGR